MLDFESLTSQDGASTSMMEVSNEAIQMGVLKKIRH